MRNITILFFTFFIALGLKAQVTVKPGLRAGVNFSKFTHTDFDYHTDFYAGGFVAIKLSRYYTLQPEVTYSAQGGKADFSYYDPSINEYKSEDISVGYLSFAVVNKFTFSDQFNVHFGPTMDFETDGNVETNSDVDLAFMAGIGYTLPFGLSLEARIKKGIVDVLESDDYNNSNNFVDDYNTNLVFQLGLSYSFDVTGTTK